jgi:hypothetical protein
MPEKRTWELTKEEILSMGARELRSWMTRVMNRLWKLVDRETYDRLTNPFIVACRGGLEYARKGLIELVKVIKNKMATSRPTLRVVT